MTDLVAAVALLAATVVVVVPWPPWRPRREKRSDPLSRRAIANLLDDDAARHDGDQEGRSA